MENTSNIKSRILSLISILLIVLWAMVSIEKLLDLDVFHKSLLRQSFPKSLANILYLGLPLIELATVILIIWPKRQTLLYIGMWISSILMLSFTIYIGLGLAGLYPTPSCGCAFIIESLTWDQHFIFNLFFLIISLLGIWLSKPKYNQEDPDTRYRKSVSLWWSTRAVSVSKLKKLLSLPMVFNRKKYTRYRRGTGI